MEEQREAQRKTGDYAGICEKLRIAIEPAPTYSISLHDADGDTEWLSESSFGPDQHRAVAEALDLFGAQPDLSMVVQDLGGARSALILGVANYQRELLGVIMLTVDSMTARQIEGNPEDFLTLSVQRTLHQYARILELERQRRTQTIIQPAPMVDPEVDRLSEALRSSPIELHVQRLVPLHPDTEHRRYEVLLRSKASLMQNAAPRTLLKTAIANGLGSMIDRRVLTELIGWLVRHPTTWQVHGLTFSVNLTRTSLHDPHFVRFVELCMTKAGLPRGTVGFEIDVPTALRASEQMSGLASSLQGVGCQLILDDFTTDGSSLELLRLPGLAMLKIAGGITAKGRTDRIARASLSALIQRARAQNLLTVAKRIRSRTDEQWLSDLGFDFIQSHAFSMPVTIGSLVKRFGINPTQA